MPDVPEPHEVNDLAALKALAHPLRVRMYDLLGDEGPATASQLGARLGESSGTTSYHLRMLAEHGFIEEDPDRGNKRDRYWRVRGFSLQTAELLDDPEAVRDLRVVSQELWRAYARQIETWFRTAERWGKEWTDVSVSHMSRFEATREEMQALRDDVLGLIEQRIEGWNGRDAPEGSTRAVLQFHLFPLGEPKEDGEAATD
jgi:DNA-binding transcriptional ArsR family regulator